MAFNCLDVVWLDNFTLLVLNANLFTVKLCNHKVDASQRLEECDLLFNK